MYQYWACWPAGSLQVEDHLPNAVIGKAFPPTIMKSLRSFPAPSPCSGLLSTVNTRLLKCFSKVHMSFSSCPTKICVLVMETISNRWRQAYCNKRRLFIKVAAPTVFPFTSWGLFIMAFVVFPTTWLQETPRFGNLSSIRMVLSCSGPAAHSFKDRIWKKSSERMERLCVLKEFDFLKYRFSAWREGALKAQSMGGWGGSCMCSHSGRVQHHDYYASHRLH